MKFQKFQGAGNDFIIVEAQDLEKVNYEELAKKVCHRRFGIGADGLIVVASSNIADFRMIFFNADGSEATMCGNGIRCFAKYVFDQELISKTKFNVETLAGIMEVQLIECGECESLVEINLGQVSFIHETIPKLEQTDNYLNQPVVLQGETYHISSVFIGTIHTVIFVDKIDEKKAKEIGPVLEHHELFKSKTNVSFCEVVDEQTLNVLTWEKGVGLTLACGTATCACTVVSSLLKNTSSNVLVNVSGGQLNVRLEEGNCFMTGAATLIATGEYLY